MSLHINLIYDTEQRSASLVSLRFALRLIGILIPVLILLLGFFAFFQIRQLRNELAMKQAVWETLEPRYEAAQELQRELETIRAIENEINGWLNARLEWVAPLSAIRDVVPPTIQLVSLHSEERLELDGTTLVRACTLTMDGRARGTSPQADVEQLRRGMSEHPQLADIFREVVIPPGTFQADPARDAEREHRIFRLHARLYPRRFE